MTDEPVPVASVPAQPSATPKVTEGDPSPGAWSPFAIALFRNFWIGTFLLYIGTWASDMAVNWLMSDVTNSRLLISLIAAASSMPFFILAFPAGVLTERTSPRTLLLLALAIMTVAGVAMSAILLTGAIVSPWLLLMFVFAVGVGNALFDPIWRTVLPQIVDPARLMPAYALDGVALNLSRALGPLAAAGLLLAIGPAGAFILFVASCAVMMVLILAWRPATTPTGTFNLRTMANDMRGGVQFVRFSTEIRRVFLRVALFIFPFTAMWSALPLVGREIMQLPAVSYAAMVGCAGLGALFAAASINWIRARVATEVTLFAGCLLLIINMIAMGYWQSLPILCATMFGAGIGWLLVLTKFQSVLVPALPLWVRNRVIALYSLIFFGLVTVGSIFWGSLQELTTDAGSVLLGAAMLALVFAIAGYRLPLPGAQAKTGSAAWQPTTLYEALPAGSAAIGSGPVVVSIDYRVRDGLMTDFLTKLQDVGRLRRKLGAYHWTVLRDLEKPNLVKEQFIMSSTDDYAALETRSSPDDRAVYGTLLGMAEKDTKTNQRQFILADLL